MTTQETVKGEAHLGLDVMSAQTDDKLEGPCALVISINYPTSSDMLEEEDI